MGKNRFDAVKIGAVGFKLGFNEGALAELEALEWWNGTSNMNSFYQNLQRYIDKRKKELI